MRQSGINIQGIISTSFPISQDRLQSHSDPNKDKMLTEKDWMLMSQQQQKQTSELSVMLGDYIVNMYSHLHLI